MLAPDAERLLTRFRTDRTLSHGALHADSPVGFSEERVEECLADLVSKGLVSRSGRGWRITAGGRDTVKQRPQRGRFVWSLVGDREIHKAVTRISLRAERHDDLDRLAATFVDFGISDRIDTDNSQVIYGR